MATHWIMIQVSRSQHLIWLDADAQCHRRELLVVTSVEVDLALLLVIY